MSVATTVSLVTSAVAVGYTAVNTVLSYNEWQQATLELSKERSKLNKDERVIRMLEAQIARLESGSKITAVACGAVALAAGVGATVSGYKAKQNWAIISGAFAGGGVAIIGPFIDFKDI